MFISVLFKLLIVHYIMFIQEVMIVDNIERWADMPGFEQYYEISDQGRARSKERRYINQQGRIITKPL